MNDSDDFLSDIDAAVEEKASGLTDTQPITNDVTPKPTPEADPNEANKIAQEVLDLTASDEERAEKKRETLSVNRDKKEEDKVDDPDKKEESEDKQEQKDDKDKQEDKTQTEEGDAKEKRLYMDRFLGTDKEGNLVLGDGTVIAAKGTARTYYENLKREARAQRDAAEQAQVNTYKLGEKFKELYNRYNALSVSDEVKSISERTGMSSGEVKQAIDTMVLLREDPIKGLKKVLTQAAANGIDISSLGIGNGAIDLSAIKDMLTESRQDTTVTKPVKTQEELQQEAVEQVQDFIKEHRDAEGNLTVTETEINAVAAAKAKFPDHTLQELLIAYRRHARTLAEKDEEEKFTSNVNKEHRYQRRREQPEQQSRQRKQHIAKPTTDYATMDYKEIAASLLDDFGD